MEPNDNPPAETALVVNAVSKPPLANGVIVMCHLPLGTGVVRYGPRKVIETIVAPGGNTYVRVEGDAEGEYRRDWDVDVIHAG